MAQTVKILNWNIQNYGKTKSSFADVVNGIAKIVYDIRPDIFVLLELNTTIDATAKQVASVLANALYKLSKKDGKNEYRLCLISPNTGLEYYAFFIRDAAYTIPLAPFNKITNKPETCIGGLFYTPFSDVDFFKKQYAYLAGKATVASDACLLYPDIEKTSSYGRSLGPTFWPGTRQPALGIFWCPGATGANKLLPVIACHFAADGTVAANQFNTLRYFSLLNGISPAPLLGAKPVPVPINCELTKGTVISVDACNYILTGDFNVNYLDSTDKLAYGAITGTSYPNLGAALAINSGTHLATYKDYKANRYKSTGAFAINGFDNFFLRSGPTAPAVASFANSMVTDVPGSIKNRTIELEECVTHYAELDQRGFSEGDYKYVAVDYEAQLKGNADVNLTGSLVGGRLVSDHLPVSFTVTL